MEQNSQLGRTEGAAGLTCSEFDALLSDALDGALSPASERRFDLHRQQCATCGLLFGEVAAGMNWLNTLEEIAPPANLVHTILASTSMQPKTALAAVPKLSWKERLAEVARDLAVPFRGFIREPRLAMTTAMALFSITLSLNLAGVHLADLKHIDLRPSAIRETATIKFTETSNRIIHYYNSIRLVYEVESRLQELKRATTNDEEQQPRRERNKTENDKKERRQNYYSTARDATTAALLAKRSTNELKHRSIEKDGLISTTRDSQWVTYSTRQLRPTMTTASNRSPLA